jgi:cystathionine beta-lyase/cystathionine gamma-synthase
MSVLQNRSLATRAVHAGERRPPVDHVPVATPISPSVGYVYASMDEMDAVFAGERSGSVYLRYDSPTVAAFETAMASVELGSAAQAYSSGMAAIHGALLAAGARAGTAVVAALDLYGATYTLLQRLLSTLGIDVRLVDIANVGQVEQALRESRARVLLAETISNPLLKIADLDALAAAAHAAGASLLVDNTFASPYLLNPLANRADFVIHSATKYISGHGDVLAGVVVTNGENRARLNELNKLIGAVLGPFEAWLALRGLKTLPLRMRHQCESAQKVAEWLEQQPQVARVNYPGLAHHPQHEVAKRQFGGRGFGGVLSFELRDADRSRVFHFMEALQICLPATTLGDIYSLVLHPATSSHRSLTAEERAQVGIKDGLVRLSVGIESTDDIIADLQSALQAVG